MKTALIDTSKKSLVVLAVVVACFAVLWPKIFYPMVVSILFAYDNEEEKQNEIGQMDFYDLIHPQMREAMGEARPSEKKSREGKKALFHPSVQHISKPQTKDAGAVNLVIPVYSIAIILFFIYSLFKTILAKQQEPCWKSKHKIADSLNHKFDEVENNVLAKRNENIKERKTQRAFEQYGKAKVLTALKTIILEMEDFKGNINGTENKALKTGDSVSPN